MADRSRKPRRTRSRSEEEKEPGRLDASDERDSEWRRPEEVDQAEVSDGRDHFASPEYRGRTEDEWRYGRGNYDDEWTTGNERHPAPEHIVDPQLEGGFGEPESSYSEYDDSSSGPYSGLGPKNYQPSNDHIAEEINDRLTRHGYLNAREIQVEVNNGQVVLGGIVDSRRARRLAEDITGSVAGVSHIINKLRIEQNGQR